jgi:trk system potassium uptake protein TrkH
MRQSYVWSNIGSLLVITGFAMLLPMAAGLYYGEPEFADFGRMAAITILAGLGLHELTRIRTRKRISLREGYALVTYAWIVVTVFAMVPYLLTGTFDTITDAFFEAMSGFATVGASVLDDLDNAPKAILMWRSVTHWLGGMGIIVLFVALMANMGASAMQIFKAETAGPVKDKLQPKLADSARILWLIYLINTTITFVVLYACGMNGFDALNHAFSVVATGGFSTKTASIGYYDSVLLQWAMTGCMFMAGINYALFFYLYRTRSLRCFKDSLEFKVYLTVTLIAILLITGNSLSYYGQDVFTALRYAAFHVTSILTTTGFVCCDYELWLPGAKFVLIALMLSGACAGSTTCGFKIDRHIILVKRMYYETQRFLHPRMVRTVKANQKQLPEQVVHSVTTFFYLFVALTLVSTFILCCMGMDLLSAFTGSLSCLGGVGPALGFLGPAESFSAAPTAAKWLFSALMLIGRLEIFTVLAVFWPDKHRHLWYKKIKITTEADKIKI